MTGMPWKPSNTVPAANGFVEPCLLTQSERVPSGPGWVFELKHDGYRLMIRRSEDRVRNLHAVPIGPNGFLALSEPHIS